MDPKIPDAQPLSDDLNPELQSLKKYGFSHDFFNEIFSAIVKVDPFIKNCKRGLVKTYSQRFADQPEILRLSDPDIVAQLDLLMTEAIAAAKADDEQTVQIKVDAIEAYRNRKK